MCMRSVLYTVYSGETKAWARESYEGLRSGGNNGSGGSSSCGRGKKDLSHVILSLSLPAPTASIAFHVRPTFNTLEHSPCVV